MELCFMGDPPEDVTMVEKGAWWSSQFHFDIIQHRFSEKPYQPHAILPKTDVRLASFVAMESRFILSSVFG